MHKYTAKLSLLLLIILEGSIYNEGVLSEGVLSGRSLCLDGVMYGGCFVRGCFVRGVLSGEGFVPPSHQAALNGDSMYVYMKVGQNPLRKKKPRTKPLRQNPLEQNPLHT